MLREICSVLGLIVGCFVVGQSTGGQHEHLSADLNDHLRELERGNGKSRAKQITCYSRFFYSNGLGRKEEVKRAIFVLLKVSGLASEVLAAAPLCSVRLGLHQSVCLPEWINARLICCLDLHFSEPLSSVIMKE